MTNLINRRVALTLAGGAAAAASVPALSAGKAKNLIDPTTIDGGLTALVKTIASLDTKQQTLLFSTGTGLEPWFRVYMLNAIRIFPAEEGYRQVSNQLFFFGHLTEDRILDTWRNPITNKEVSVFHGHNGPMNIELKPYQMKLGADAQTKEKVPFLLPWKRNGKILSLHTELKSRRQNQLDASWGDAYTGPFVQSIEWVQWVAPEDEIVNPKVDSAMPSGTITRHGGWYPWMMMGTRPGSFLTEMTGTKIASINEMPVHVRDYAKATYPDYLKAPDSWTGKYIDNMTVYKTEHPPQ